MTVSPEPHLPFFSSPFCYSSIITSTFFFQNPYFLLSPSWSLISQNFMYLLGTYFFIVSQFLFETTLPDPFDHHSLSSFHILLTIWESLSIYHLSLSFFLSFYLVIIYLSIYIYHLSSVFHSFFICLSVYRHLSNHLLPANLCTYLSLPTTGIQNP